MKKTLKTLFTGVLMLVLASGVILLCGCGKRGGDGPTVDSGTITGIGIETGVNAVPVTSVTTPTDPGTHVTQAPAPPAYYEGTVYLSSEGGGHVAVFRLAIDPANTAAPISLTAAPATIQLSPGTGVLALAMYKTGGGGQVDHVFHDVRFDSGANRLYYSSVLANPVMASPVHLGYVDLSDNSVHDNIIAVDLTKKGPSYFVYSGSGQTATHYLPVTMLHPAYVDAIPKSGITGGAEAIFGQIESIAATVIAPIITSPAVSPFFSAINGVLLQSFPTVTGSAGLLPLVGNLLEGGLLSGIGGLPIDFLGGAENNLLASLTDFINLLNTSGISGLPVIGAALGGSGGATVTAPFAGLISPDAYKRTFVEQFRGDSDYCYAGGAGSTDGKYMYVAVNETTAGGGGQAAKMTGAFKAYLLRMDDFISGTVTSGSIVATGSVPGSAGATIAFRSTFTPDGARILQSGGDRLVVLDAATLKPLNGAGGDTAIGGSKKGIWGANMFDAPATVENHDAIATADGRYAVLVIKYVDKTGQAETTGLQLYDLTAMKQVGDPTNVCGVCHAPTMQDGNSWYIARGGCGIDGRLNPGDGSTATGANGSGAGANTGIGANTATNTNTAANTSVTTNTATATATATATDTGTDVKY